ncbi:putative hAT family C-terminal dimerization region-containing protein 27 [Homarus americanus]|uniref:Putative hAT family C-terminal dimerization region-containing protein 27 n=1 Tax=Homarus americanus TaxID=6706 RepID=A0A8J5NA92_HOMAM|nr:putative hAT family C-terminal dimerization region-containing protein 27 [Homarus americanus]
MEIGDLEMQLIDFKLSSLWVVKFTELRKSLETTVSDHAASISSCWASLPEKFDCMKKVAFVLLSTFESTYLCEQLFSYIKNILNPHRSRLTTDHSEGVSNFKVSRYASYITTLSKGKQGQGSH